MEAVLSASYGDEQQRAANRARPDKLRSRQIYEQHKAKPKPGVGAQLPSSHGPPPGKSPFWLSKYQGKAYGAFNPLPQKPAVARAPAHVEIRPGVLVGVQQHAKPRSTGEAAGSGRDGADLSSVAAADRQLACHAPALLQLEEVLRAAGKSRAALHCPARQVLLSAFAQVGECVGSAKRASKIWRRLPCCGGRCWFAAPGSVSWMSLTTPHRRCWARSTTRWAQPTRSALLSLCKSGGRWASRCRSTWPPPSSASTATMQTAGCPCRWAGVDAGSAGQG